MPTDLYVSLADCCPSTQTSFPVILATTTLHQDGPDVVSNKLLSFQQEVADQTLLTIGSGRSESMHFDVIILTHVSSLHSNNRVCSIVFAQHAHNMIEHAYGVTDRSLSFPSYLISNVISVMNKIQSKVTKRGWHSYLHLCPHIGRRSRRLCQLCIQACYAAGLVSFGASKKFHAQLSPRSKKHKLTRHRTRLYLYRLSPFSSSNENTCRRALTQAYVSLCIVQAHVHIILHQSATNLTWLTAPESHVPATHTHYEVLASTSTWLTLNIRHFGPFLFLGIIRLGKDVIILPLFDQTELHLEKRADILVLRFLVQSSIVPFQELHGTVQRFNIVKAKIPIVRFHVTRYCGGTATVRVARRHEKHVAR